MMVRKTAPNSRNHDSSRGHAIFTVEVRHIEQNSTFGKMAFVDLAGSERGQDTLQSGRTTQSAIAHVGKLAHCG